MACSSIDFSLRSLASLRLYVPHYPWSAIHLLPIYFVLPEFLSMGPVDLPKTDLNATAILETGRAYCLALSSPTSTKLLLGALAMCQ